MREKKQADYERMQSDKAICTAILARDQRAQELEDVERSNRRKIQAATAKYNLELVSEWFHHCLFSHQINSIIRQLNVKVNVSRNIVNRKKITWLKCTICSQATC